VIMWNRATLGLLLVLAGCGAVAQNQFQTQFQDYDYDPAPRAPPRQSPRRGQAPDTRGQPTTPRTETTTNIAILKQINEHNEDGSYTYGYEASDGTFKLETRFVDGTVQGKYGYIDANGDVKIIEYGADAMGFQPEGDLPDGIVIPPPVEGNCTDCNYDYDYPDLSREEESRRTVVNRARTSPSDQTRAAGSTNQSRGQQLSQPITPAPLPRRVQAAQSKPAAPAFQAAAPAFLPTPPPARPAPARPAPARPAPARPAPARPAPARPAPVRQQQEQAPQRNFNANRSRGSSRGASPIRNAAPTRSREPSPVRNAAPSNPAPPRSQPSPPRSQPSSLSFSNFPARDSSSIPSRKAPARPAARPAPEQQRNSAPAQPTFRQPEPPRNTVPSFQNFSPQQNIQPAFVSRPAPPPSRPAITFQDPEPAPAPQPTFQQRPAAPPANLPKSALEVVDFNQLLKEFQGRPTQPRGDPQRFAPAPQQPSFAAQPAVPGVFQSTNFPVRY